MILTKQVDDKQLEITFKSRQLGDDEDDDDYSVNNDDGDIDEQCYTDFTV